MATKAKDEPDDKDLTTKPLAVPDLPPPPEQADPKGYKGAVEDEEDYTIAGLRRG